MKALAFLARRFVAGETGEDAVRAGERLHRRGIKATFDELGEDVLDREAARRAAEASKALLRLIPPHLERNVSIKLSSMGQEISRDFCLEMAAGILDVAREVGGFVRLDMEGSKLTEDTIRVFHELRKSHENVGIVLQAYLHRTGDDVREAVARGDRVRLCKGAYREPASVALTEMSEIRKSFMECARLLLDGGNYPALATHDEELVQGTLAYARARGVAAARYEFQMLYGLRPKRWDELVAAGHNVRVYVPFGTHWFPYFYRRLRERRENVFFVVKSLVGG
ncbi:MAG TPA: proline dehydrogenase family protein [Vicinamibacteria bacterium]|nr:proline dehydrogenase family protein [Vicinamibacteria bacterium]